MVLPTPKEPKELKKKMRAIRNRFAHSGDVDWESFSVWAGNQLPKYLWETWEESLKERGLTWQKFLKLLRYRTDKILLWFRGEISWKKLVEGIKDLIEGPLGKELAKR